MHFYRQPILIFGMVLPSIACIALCATGYVAMSSMNTKFRAKVANFKTYDQARLAALAIESQVTKEREHTDRWKQQFEQETASAVQSTSRAILEKMPPKELQQTAFERPGTRGGFGAVSSQNSSQVRISFRGNFRTMQRAFLELETRMPQLQLQEFRMDPASNQPNLLNFQVTYTAWEQNTEVGKSGAAPMMPGLPSRKR